MPGPSARHGTGISLEAVDANEEMLVLAREKSLPYANPEGPCVVALDGGWIYAEADANVRAISNKRKMGVMNEKEFVHRPRRHLLDLALLTMSDSIRCICSANLLSKAASNLDDCCSTCLCR